MLRFVFLNCDTLMKYGGTASCQIELINFINSSEPVKLDSFKRKKIDPKLKEIYI